MYHITRNPSKQHVTSSSLSWQNLLLLVEHNKIQKLNSPLVAFAKLKVRLCLLYILSHIPHFHTKEKSLFWVLNIEGRIEYPTVSSFAHFIEWTATQNLYIALMPVAMFCPSLPFPGFMISVSFCSVVVVSALFMLSIFYGLIPFHYSFCFHFICAMFVARCTYVIIFMLLFISV